jgi:hypothetical protein
MGFKNHPSVSPFNIPFFLIVWIASEARVNVIEIPRHTTRQSLPAIAAAYEINLLHFQSVSERGLIAFYSGLLSLPPNVLIQHSKQSFNIAI